MNVELTDVRRAILAWTQTLERSREIVAGWLGEDRAEGERAIRSGEQTLARLREQTQEKKS